MAALEEYRRKRDPAATAEPMPGATPKSGPGGNSFVVQEHHASALHWDFRLERDGVLVSWAVPKGLPTDPSVNRLAVHVEDHPLEYATYEGEIAHGQYGGGQVSIWDSGTYDTETWTAREVKIVLFGRRVRGRFVLFQTGGTQWMMHRMDGPPRPDWARLPTRVAPMLATDGSVPHGRGWSYELAWPGVRATARVEGGRVELFAAGPALDEVSNRFPEVRTLGEQVGTTQLLLDGVLVRFAGPIGFDRDAVQARLLGPVSRIRGLARAAPVTYLVVDLLHVDGRSLLGTAYRDRRAALDELELDGAASQVPPNFASPAAAVLAVARDQGLSRVLAKRQSSPYRPGERSSDWVAVPT